MAVDKSHDLIKVIAVSQQDYPDGIGLDDSLDIIYKVRRDMSDTLMQMPDSKLQRIVRMSRARYMDIRRHHEKEKK